MAKVIPFRPRDAKLDAEAARMLRVADEIDQVILRHLGDQMRARDMAGLLAHRLGTLMRHIDPTDREVLWHVVQKVLREQSDIV